MNFDVLFDVSLLRRFFGGIKPKKKRKSWYAALKKKVVIRAVLRTECEINSNGVTAVKSQLNRDNFALNITRADLKYVK
jgi:hypothetical protein